MSEPRESTPEERAEASRLGWTPKESFKGDEAKFVDAHVYLERGKELLPLLKASNRKLEEKVGTLTQQVQRLEGALSEANESMEALTKFNSEANRTNAKTARRDLTAQLVKAREDGDVDTILDLEDKIAELNTTIRTAEAEPDDEGEEPPKRRPAGDGLHPQFKQDFTEWQAERAPWFTPNPTEDSDPNDVKKTRFAMGVATAMKADPQFKGLKGRAFLDALADEVESTYGGKPARRTDRVESGGDHSNGSGNKGTRSYNDLPSDAKAQCDKEESKMVGPNRAFKTQADWRKHYISKLPDSIFNRR